MTEIIFHQQQTKNPWDQKALSYTNPWERGGEQGRQQWLRLFSIFQKHVVFTNAKTILDVGCGKGTLLSFIKVLAPQSSVIELDSSEGMLEGARKQASAWKMQNVTFLQKEGQQTELPANTADTVVIFNALPHFPDKKTALQEWNRVLKMGGKLYIIHSQSRQQLNAMHARNGFNPTVDSLPTMKEMSALISQTGLQLATFFDNPGLDYVLISAIKLYEN